MIRFTTAILLMLAFAFPTFAAEPKTELSLAGEFVQTESHDNPWVFNMSLLNPVGSGYLLLGPALAIGSVDEANRLGGAIEINLAPRGAVSPYFGASGYYFQKDTDGLDRHVVIASAGFKINVGEGAAIKLGAFDVVDGRGKDGTDLGISAGIIAKF